MAKEEIDVIAVKNSVKDLRGFHLFEFLKLFGVPSSHGVCGGKYAVYEIYFWKGCGGEVEYYFDSNNICFTDDFYEFKKMELK